MENAGIGLETRLSLLPSTSFPVLVVTVRRSIWRCLVVNPRIKERTQWKVKTTWGKPGEWNWCFSVGKCLFLSTVPSPRKMCGEGVLFRHTICSFQNNALPWRFENLNAEFFVGQGHEGNNYLFFKKIMTVFYLALKIISKLKSLNVMSVGHTDRRLTSLSRPCLSPADKCQQCIL